MGLDGPGMEKPVAAATHRESHADLAGVGLHAMKPPRSFRSIRSGARLLSGSLKLPFLRTGNSANTALVSVDIFGTLVARSGDDDAAWRVGAVECVAVGAARGLPPNPDPVRLRREVERELSQERVAA
jgi:hypothetical protein